ncbi:MAG: methanogen output domain 1-containing protein, partial [Thermoplasmata archaeon]|nr:methanogen output domain 1-containing protein [Thermoplasmata archaeon]
NYTYEREQDKFIIRNTKCIWMNELGPNPHFCFMAKCVISKFAMKTGREFNLELNKAIMDGSEECVFELTFI